MSFTSSSLFYHRTFTASSAADGRYTFVSDVNAHRLIPRVPFLVKATYPLVGVVSPDVDRSFLVGNATSTTNVSFTNTGQVIGFVKRANGSAAPGGQVTVVGRNVAYAVAPDASFSAGGSCRVHIRCRRRSPCLAAGRR
ncbi:MAG: hypothetical protein QM736_03560 [Vicinamibacterales bacterium]